MSHSYLYIHIVRVCLFI